MKTADTQTLVQTADPQGMLTAFETHLRDDHDMVFQDGDDGERFVAHGPFRVGLTATGAGLRIAISSPNENALVFFKEEIAEHVAEYDAPAAAAMRWSGEQSVAGAVPPNFRILQVVQSEPLFAGLQRVTLRFPNISDLVDDGLHVRLMMPKDVGRAPVWPVMAENGSPVWPQGDDELHARFITIADHDLANETVALDIASHDDGLVSRWAVSAKPGDAVGAMGPAGLSALPVRESYLLAADLTAISSLKRLARDIPASARITAIVAAPAGFDPADYFQRDDLSLRLVEPDAFESTVQARIAQEMDADRAEFVWFAGEFENAQSTRKFLKSELGMTKDDQLCAAYWRRGHAGYGS